jgi:N-acetylglucosamine kinase-like BadF-type ATPase
MILIADSGSTKCDWLLVDKDESFYHFNTIGFNPYFHDQLFISSVLNQHKELSESSPYIKNIFFYGAGCSSGELNVVVNEALKSVFINAHVHVEHDMVAAAYATYSGQPCISCILGTGSNSCFFDGNEVSEKLPALGYILGDEGSGSYYGKKLLTMFLYNQLPEHLARELKKEYYLSKDVIVENVYMKPHANVYLASFMKFLSQHKNDNFVREMVYEGMFHFLRNHVCCFYQYKEVPVHFVGSVAWHFQDVLYQAAEDIGIRVGKIVRKPIENLAKYHLKKVYHKSHELINSI